MSGLKPGPRKKYLQNSQTQQITSKSEKINHIQIYPGVDLLKFISTCHHLSHSTLVSKCPLGPANWVNHNLIKKYLY